MISSSVAVQRLPNQQRDSSEEFGDRWTTANHYVVLGQSSTLLYTLVTAGFASRSFDLLRTDVQCLRWRARAGSVPHTCSKDEVRLPHPLWSHEPRTGSLYLQAHASGVRGNCNSSWNSNHCYKKVSQPTTSPVKAELVLDKQTREKWRLWRTQQWLWTNRADHLLGAS